MMTTAEYPKIATHETCHTMHTKTATFVLPFAGERKIPVKAVCTMPDTFMQPPSHSKVLRWIKKGVRGNRLEAHREGETIWTSVEAVHRFLQRGNKASD